MTDYKYATVWMRTNHSRDKNQSMTGEQNYVRWEKGSPQSTLFEVLTEYGAKGWRYVGFVPNGPMQTDQLIFERENP